MCACSTAHLHVGVCVNALVSACSVAHVRVSTDIPLAVYVIVLYTGNGIRESVNGVEK